MQNSVLKFLTLLFLLICSSAYQSPAQVQSVFLSRADSLFQQKRYIQSFELYQTILDQHHYSPAMLLKMAYIQEGLNQIALSAYYLNLYYQVSQDETALAKMEEVATKYQLEGYSVSDFDTLHTLYRHNHTTITIAIGAILLFFLVLLSVQRFRSHQKPYAAWSFFVLFSSLLFVHLYLGDERSVAIISHNNTYLMQGPSSGSSVVSIVRDGHRVKVMGKKDVWVKVLWGDQEVYIKENHLLPVAL